MGLRDYEVEGLWELRDQGIKDLRGYWIIRVIF